MFVTSFKATSSVLTLQGLFPNFSSLTFDNFIHAWTKGNFARYFLNSVIVSGGIVLGNIFFDTTAAYALARRKFFGKTIVMVAILAKLMIPAAVLMVPTFILVRKLGIYDTYAALIFPFLAETFGIFVLRQYILSIPTAYEEAARSEGAGEWKIFFSIIFPLCKPALAVTIIHSVMTSWNMYIYPLILTSSDSMRTLPLGIAFYRVNQTDIHSGHLMAGSVIVVLPVILAFFIFQKQIITSLTQGGIKS
jgi:multiple sugar transport system permease protein